MLAALGNRIEKQVFRYCRGFSSKMTRSTIQETIQEKLTTALTPTFLEVINESYMHNVPKDSETHFKIVIVSDKFDGTKLLERHRLVNDILSFELQNGVHALSMSCKTQSQWKSCGAKVSKSPSCMGGMKKEKSDKS